jgi:hypothetical protein
MIKKTTFLRAVTILLIVLIVLPVMLKRLRFHVETYKDNVVSAGLVRVPLRLINPHVDQNNYLEVHGKYYEHVRGVQPYYLPLPEIEAILFVTEDRSNHAEFHIVSLKSGKVTDIFGGKSSFGGHITNQRQQGEPYTDYVDKVTPQELYLASRYPDAENITVLDLEHHKVGRTERNEYDDSGKIVLHKVYSSDVILK